jgi:hypothetical protein
METKPTPEGFTLGLIGKAYGSLIERCKGYSRLLGMSFIIVDTLEPLDSRVYRVPSHWTEEQIDGLALECCQSVNWRWVRG